MASQSQKDPNHPEVDILQDGDLVFARISSKRFPWRKYNVFYNKIDDIAACECDGWFNSAAKGKGKCWHVTLLKKVLAILHDEKPLVTSQEDFPFLTSGQS